VRYPEIQSLRALAVLAVVFYHLQLGFPMGFLGVDVFFVISGFVIGRLIFGRFSRAEMSFLVFFRERAARLFPPLAVAASFAICLAALFGSPEAFDVSFLTAIGALFGVSNISIQIVTGDYFAPTAQANFLLHTWSLGVEEQSYLVLYAFIALGVILKKRLLSIGLLAIFGLASFTLFLLRDEFQGVPILWALFGFYSPVTRFWEFAAGAMAFLLSKYVSRHQKFIWLPSALFIGILILMFFDLEDLFAENSTYVVVVFLTTLFVLVVPAYSSRLGGSAFLTKGLLIWLGDRSYSVYLFHWPIFVTAGFLSNWTLPSWVKVAGLFLTLLLGHLSYTYVESIRRKGQSIGRSHLQIATSGALALVVMMASHGFAGQINSRFQQQSLQRLEANTLEELGCADSANYWCLNLGYWDESSYSGKTYFLIGDSNAAMFFPAIYGALKESGISLISKTEGSCPGFEIASAGATLQADCRDYISDLWSHLEEIPPTVIFLGFTDQYVLASPPDRANQVASDLILGVRHFSRRLQQLDHKLVVIEPIPNLNLSHVGYEPWLWPKTNRENLNLGLKKSGVMWTLISSMKRELAKEEKLMWNTEELLCPNGNCSVIQNGKYLYKDGNHITRYKSQEMQREVAEFLEFHSLD
jgi:peptidoglycan/LPS O-acetylase OafA/YrhL